MKNLAIAGTLSLALAVAGCASTSTSPSTSTTTVIPASVLTEAQQIASTACAVTPTLATLANIGLALAGAGAATIATSALAEQMASAFCGGVTKLSARRGASVRAIGSAVIDYGSVTIGGVAVDLQGVPAS